MEKTLSKVQLTRNFFTGEYCIKTDKGKRLTRWFGAYEETVVGNFVKLETDKGVFVYHKNQAELLYGHYNECGFVFVDKLTEEIYYLQKDGSPLELLTIL